MTWVTTCNQLAAQMPAAALARMRQHAAARAQHWQQAAQFAAAQPLVSTLTSEAFIALQHHNVALQQMADMLVVVGSGGASLGAQALCALAPNDNVRFLKNCDPHSTNALLGRLDLQRTAWLFISKSGETVETIASALAVIAYYEPRGAILAGRVRVITEEKPSSLRALAVHEGWECMAHPMALGGRFSVFSVVGMLPAAFAGIDIHALIHAVQQAHAQVFETQPEEIFQAASVFASSLPEQPLHVVMAYSDALAPYTQWYKQLWAESLGKNGTGPTPITAIGAVDQHSQLQLYLDGPRDKLFTLILPEYQESAVVLAQRSVPGVDYLGAHTMRDIMRETARATVMAMQVHHLPLRVVEGPLEVTALACFMLQHMVETLLVASMLPCNPFDQPAVEEGKRLTRGALGA
jgi:glucose-6-phosphate isomerase